MNKFVSPISEFMKHEDYSLFSLLSVMIYFAQMYFKLGWMISELMFSKYHISISIISALFFSFSSMNITASILINNTADGKKGININREFLFYDLIISLFFYGNLIPKFITTENYGLIGVVVFFSIFTARGLYHLSEQFRINNVKRDQAIKITNDYDDLVGLLSKLLGVDATSDNITDNIISSINDIKDTLASHENQLKTNESDNSIIKKELENSSKELDMVNKSLNDLEFNYDKLVAKNDELKSENQVLGENNKNLLNDIRHIISEIDMGKMRNKIAGKKGALTNMRQNPDSDEQKLLETEIFISNWESIFNKDQYIINGKKVMEEIGG